MSVKTTGAGIGFGCALAIVISWTAWHSIWWAIVHGFRPGICSILCHSVHVKLTIL